MRKCFITTKDNPHDPYEEFDAWYRYDMDHGYDSCGLLDRVARTSDQLTEQENDREIERAIKEIIKYDVLDLYRMKIKNIDKKHVKNTLTTQI